MKKLGNLLGICILLLVALSFFTVAIHFFFNKVFISIQEIIIYLHSTAFMLGIVYAYHYDKHVRIDIFYQNFPDKKKRKVNTFGTLLLLLPFFLFILYVSYDYVYASWSKLEGSSESGGLPFVYGLKTLILIMPLSMLIYALIKLLRKT
jgi:TRAP-type mannitol/chloroaromatic compound transport system permease small subunit